MSEKQAGNPFEPENLATGGGLWDDKVVTITGAKTEIDRLKYGDGSEVKNERTGEAAVRNVLSITGIADDEENERRETYSAGGLLPTPDGEGFVKPDGTKGFFDTRSEMGLLVNKLKESGFPVEVLYDGTKTQMSKFVGARFHFHGEAQLDKDGKVKKTKKGYDAQKFWPDKFLGWKDGKAAPATGASQTSLRDKAVEIMVDILAKSGGTASRAEVIRKISAEHKMDPDCNKIIALVAVDSFHASGVPWVKDGTGFRLGE